MAWRRLVAAHQRRRPVVGHRLLERLALLDGLEQGAPVGPAAAAATATEFLFGRKTIISENGTKI